MSGQLDGGGDRKRGGLSLLRLSSPPVWWLSRQRLFAKPWLEEGLAGEFRGTSASQLPAAKLGLGVFLAVVGSCLRCLCPPYVMRMEMADWRPLPTPSILWFNTGLLILSSIALHWAPRAEPCATRIGTPRIGIHKDGCSPRRTSLIAQESSLPRIIGQAGLSRQQSATPSLSSAVASAGSPRTEARTTSMAAPARFL